MTAQQRFAEPTVGDSAAAAAAGPYYARLRVSHEWATPWPIFAGLNVEFSFDLDVCATAENAKCARYISPHQDGLSQRWVGTCWMNPPYGRAIGEWVAKAVREASLGATVVCLLPARTDTAWWHDYVLGMGAEVRYLRGRIRFNNGRGRAPFPSVVVIFRPPATRADGAR